MRSAFQRKGTQVFNFVLLIRMKPGLTLWWTDTKVQHCQYQSQLQHTTLNHFHLPTIITTNLLENHLNVTHPSPFGLPSSYFPRDFLTKIVRAFLAFPPQTCAPDIKTSCVSLF